MPQEYVSLSTSTQHCCIFAGECNTSACLLQVGHAVGTIDTVWPNHPALLPTHILTLLFLPFTCFPAHCMAE